MADTYNLSIQDERMIRYRNQTIRLVSIIMIFALVIAILDIISLVHDSSKLANILSIMFDIINLFLSLIEWWALYMYKETIFKLLRYITPVGYSLVLASTIFQYTSQDSIIFEVEEIVDITAAAIILVVGIYKGYKSYVYNKATKEALDDPLKRSVLSEAEYEERLKSIL